MSNKAFLKTVLNYYSPLLGSPEWYKPIPDLGFLSCAGQGCVESCRLAALWGFCAYSKEADTDVTSRCSSSLVAASSDQFWGSFLVGSWSISDADKSVLYGKVEQKEGCA